ncbi:nucleotidyltransferase family protein [Candidatus Daviesbacteria bacterium]|nr:nucleotidyltransferase family protein [Candidatus Daviesbacteria bacterium]
MNTQISNLSQITVAILAGGFGTRLQSKVAGKQKVLAEVRNYPFLEYLLQQLYKAGFRKIVLCTGYLSGQVEKTFGTKYKDMLLLYSAEEMPLGTAGSLRRALSLLDSETVLVMNGDSFCEIDFKKFWQFHLDKGAQASLALTSVSDTSRFGKVELGDDDRIVGFEEKKEGSGAGYINAGIYLINKELLAKLPENRKISIEQEVFPNWTDKKFYGYKGGNIFIDIGTPKTYEQAEQFFAKFKF